MKKHTGSRALVSLGVLFLLSLSAWSAGTDYAMQMDKAASSLLLDIAAAGDRLVAVGERGHILYSEDQGVTWEQAKVPTSVMLTRVFFVSPQLGWAVGHDGNILVSHDGGVNWALQRDGVSEQARINEERAARAKVQVAVLRERLTTVAEQEKAGLSPTLEEAEYALDTALVALDEPVYAPPLMDIWFANEEQGWASGAYGTLLYTTNSGRQWDDWSHKVGNPDELHLNGVVGAADGSLYIASEWGMIFRSRSGGEDWETMETGYEGSFFGILVNPDSGSVFAYGLRGTVYRSRDQGATWQALPTMASASLFGGLATDNGALFFVGQAGTAIRSRDDGDSFTPLVQPERRGLHGIASMGEDHYMVTGDGGSDMLVTAEPATTVQEKGR